MDSRRGGKLYRHEYDDADHVRLLDAGRPAVRGDGVGLQLNDL
jgi:hypothetical protein